MLEFFTANMAPIIFVFMVIACVKQERGFSAFSYRDGLFFRWSLFLGHVPSSL